MVNGTVTSYRYNDLYKCYEFDLYVPPVPRSGGKPLLSSLKMRLDGVEMTPVFHTDQTTSNLDFWVEIDLGGPKNSATYGTIIIGFHTNFVPTGHIIEYQYEEVCHCIDVGEESIHPDSKCTTCYGTGYVGGYSQYICGPHIECGRVIRPKNTILCRFPITSEVLKISRYGGEIQTQRKSWAIASPMLHDWDLLIRLRAYGAPIHMDPETLTIPNERYFVTEWEHSSARPSYDLPLRTQPFMHAVDKGVTLHQRFIMQEVQPSHIVYQVPFVI